MIVPLDKKSVYEYSLVGDEGEFKTIFHLGYLTARQKAAIAIQTKKSTKETSEDSIWWFDIIRHALKGWTNFKIADGTEYEYKTEKINVSGFGEFECMALSCYEAFKLEWIAELAGKLYEINYPSDVEKKTL
jgi:nucleoside 2-deoxyribosyltransferase